MDPVNQIYSVKLELSLITREGGLMFLKYYPLWSSLFTSSMLAVTNFVDLGFLICKMIGLVHHSLKML